MNGRAKIILLSFFLLFLACASKQVPPPVTDQFYAPERLGEFLQNSALPQENEYIISIGDRLDVVFLYHSDLTTNDLVVRSDGRISLPYVGDMMAAGYRPMQLDSVLTTRFGEILKDPDLSVIIRESAPNTVYVLGEVKNPGGYPFELSVSLLQSIALAGGTLKSAKPDHSIVIRREDVSRIIGVEVDLRAIMSGAAIQNDFLLRNNDIVFVPKKRIESVAEFASLMNDILNPPVNMFMTGWKIRMDQVAYEYFLKRITDE